MAHLRGVYRQTIGHWLARYDTGGVQALLARYVPAGKSSSLPSAVLAALEQVLRHPPGFASSVARRPWSNQTPPRAVNDHPRDRLVRPRVQTTLQVPRPRHTHNTLTPCGEVQLPCQERLPRVMPPTKTRPGQVYSQDDSRLG